jgi:hypothetical protein
MSSTATKLPGNDSLTEAFRQIELASKGGRLDQKPLNVEIKTGDMVLARNEDLHRLVHEAIVRLKQSASVACPSCVDCPGAEVRGEQFQSYRTLESSVRLQLRCKYRACIEGHGPLPALAPEKDFGAEVFRSDPRVLIEGKRVSADGSLLPNMQSGPLPKPRPKDKPETELPEAW